MRTSRKSLFAAVALVLTLAGSVFAQKPEKKALVVGSPNYCATFTQLLKKDFQCTALDRKNGAKAWKDQGYTLPKYEELKQYALVVICPLANTTAENKEDIVTFVKEGGSIYYGYASLEWTFQKTKELGYGICGFDKVSAQCLRPYPKSGNMTHKLVYTKEMGKERSLTKKWLYSVYAGDLVDAVPLVENPELKGLAVACVAKYGKGQFIFFGGEDHSIFMDIMKKCGLCK